jgi:hypothetical protein
MEEQDIRQIQGAFTSTFQDAEGTWFVSLDIGPQHFNIDSSAESLEHANWLRRQLAIALLNFRQTNHLKEVCVNCKRKKRSDW